MITYEQQKLSVAMPDLQVLLPMQWEHTGEAHLPCNPAWDFYNALEATGRNVIFIARRGDHPVGYATGILHPHINSRDCQVGTIPSYFAEEGHLRPFLLRGLIERTRGWLIEQGAKQIKVSTTYHESAGRLLALMGFIPSSIEYKMDLLARKERYDA